MTCPLCRRRPPARQSGLCHGCHAELSSRTTRKPCKPTMALPGTEEKIQVLAERAARGEELFHDYDAAQPRDLHTNDTAKAHQTVQL